MSLSKKKNTNTKYKSQPLLSHSNGNPNGNRIEERISQRV